MKYTHVLWDFNGTILDDVQTGIVSVNRLLARRGLKTVPDKAYYQEVFGFPIRDYYTRLGFDFEKENFEVLAVEWVDEYMKEVVSAPINPGVRDALEWIRSHGLPQYILSATEMKMLAGQLEALGIGGYFREVLGLGDIYAGSKTELGVRWAERVRPAHAVLIGDTNHDYETALAMGVDCLLYTGGHMNRATLEKCGCPVFDDFSELYRFF